MNEISRRAFLRAMTAVAAAGVLAPSARAADGTAGAPPRRPNVLFIAVDDLRPELGCYGKALIKSPNIDRLAARGVLFQNAYCQQAVCSPSRTSLLTGCRPDTTRIYDLETHFRKTLPNIVTLPQHFKTHGYHTQSFGKIYHRGLDDPRSWSVPSTQTHVEWYQLRENRELMRKLTAGLRDDDAKMDAVMKGRIRGAPTECAEVADNAYGDGVIADGAIAALRSVKDKPFFLAAGFLKPHLPFVAPKRYWDLYRDEDIRLASNPTPPRNMPAIAGSDWGELRVYQGMPRSGPLSDEQARRLIHGYFACVSYVDAQIGRLLDELDTLRLRDNTVVVLWGDHGWKLGEHGMWCKHTNFELDTRSTLIVAAPGRGVSGAKTAALTEFVDVYPTLCDLCELPRPATLEGASFAPLLEKPDRPWKSAAFSQYPRGGVMGYSMRTATHRFTQWRERGSGKVTATELYDHVNDGDENVNIAGDPAQAGLVKELGEKLKAGWRGALPPA